MLQTFNKNFVFVQ